MLPAGLARLLPSQVIRLRSSWIPIMTPPEGMRGFHGHGAPVASARLIDAVAASLAFAALSLCVAVALTVLLAIKAGLA
jgi:hypothetical protein